jgi:DNA-binding NarL/FixJ family response regulator
MGDIRIALIEDHDLTRLEMRIALRQREGFVVVGEASNATEGLKLLERETPDVAIVDIGLPDMDGVELTRQFKKFQTETGNEKTKILILTLQDHEDVVLAAFAAGADSYCMKDASTDTLVNILRVTHEGNSWIDPAIARIILHEARQAHTGNSTIEPKTAAINEAEPAYDQTTVAYPLTERELEVLQLIVEGCSNATIAEKLYITIGTVKTHVRNILSKLSADDRTQAAVRAVRAGLVT